MKVIASTSQHQGVRPGDFHFTQDGKDGQTAELVYIGFFTCSHGETCGCDRSFSGLASMKGTTTAIIEDRPLTLASYTALLAEAMTRAGWTFVKPVRLARELLAVAANFETGDVLERKGLDVTVRRVRS